jgi:hypothetical protein
VTEEKIRENRLRRMAARQGLSLTKTRRRDRRALDYGRWRIADASGAVVAGGEDLTADEVEAYLTGRRS